LDAATIGGGCSLIIDAKELYYTVCKEQVSDRWMIFCCNAMRAEMAELDDLIFDYAHDTLLTVNYKLPRNSLHG